jgi:peptide subunit release factor 1 (eRF1)
MALEYITTRGLEGKAAGKIIIMKLVEDAQAVVEYTCPECGFSEKTKQDWKEPFVQGTGANQSFHLKCKKCGFEIKLAKLKKEAKKKK